MIWLTWLWSHHWGFYFSYVDAVNLIYRTRREKSNSSKFYWWISEIIFIFITKIESSSNTAWWGSYDHTGKSSLWTIWWAASPIEWWMSLQMAISALGYCSGYLQPLLSNEKIGFTILLQKSAHRISQRAVASMHFYGSQSDRHESIMMKNSKKVDGTCAHRFILFTFWKAIFFDWIYMPHTVFSQFTHEVEREFCILQYYQIVCAEEHSIDAVDRHSNCVRLPWDRKPAEPNKLRAARKHGLVQCDRMRRKVHIFEAIVDVQGMTRTVMRINELQRLSEQKKLSYQLF